jgi:hypothetical protein
MLAVAAQRVSECGLRLAAPIRFGSVEIIDAEIDGVADEVLIAGGKTIGAERNVRDPHPGAPEGSVVTHSRNSRNRSGRGIGERESDPDARQCAAFNELAPPN